MFLFARCVHSSSYGRTITIYYREAFSGSPSKAKDQQLAALIRAESERKIAGTDAPRFAPRPIHWHAQDRVARLLDRRSGEPRRLSWITPKTTSSHATSPGNRHMNERERQKTEAEPKATLLTGPTHRARDGIQPVRPLAERERSPSELTRNIESAGLFKGLLGGDPGISKTQALLLKRELVDEGIDFTVEHGLQIVQRDPNAVVRHPRLWEVIGADLLGALAGSHLGPARLLNLRALLLGFNFVQPGAQDGQGPRSILPGSADPDTEPPFRWEGE